MVYNGRKEIYVSKQSDCWGVKKIYIHTNEQTKNREDQIAWTVLATLELDESTILRVYYQHICLLRATNGRRLPDSYLTTLKNVYQRICPSCSYSYCTRNQWKLWICFHCVDFAEMEGKGEEEEEQKNKNKKNYCLIIFTKSTLRNGSRLTLFLHCFHGN